MTTTYHAVPRRSARLIRLGRITVPLCQILLGIVGGLAGLAAIVTIAVAIMESVNGGEVFGQEHIIPTWALGIALLAVAVATLSMARSAGRLGFLPAHIRGAVRRPFHIVGVNVLQADSG